MVAKLVGFLLLIQMATLSVYAHTGLWKEYDINDPNITLDIAGRQCERSLMHAPDPSLVEVWCEKAYELGSWESLHIIGLHTGDGSRYLAEVKKHVKAGDAQALDSLAWLYSRGRFVKRDSIRAIELYKQYLNHEDSGSFNSMQLTSAHDELYSLYKEVGDKENASKHLQFLINHEDDTVRKRVLKERMEEL